MGNFEMSTGVLSLVCVVLGLAAVIDGWKLKVPNWLTFPFVLSGLVYHGVTGGFSGLTGSLLGGIVGLGLLLLPYLIGGMGAGDVKLFAGVGAWVGPSIAFGAFCVSAIVGGVLAVGMVLYGTVRVRDWGVFRKHIDRFQQVAAEVIAVRNPAELSELAAARRSTAMLLPYGIPLAIGTMTYFFWTGLL